MELKCKIGFGTLRLRTTALACGSTAYYICLGVSKPRESYQLTDRQEIPGQFRLYSF